MSKKISFVVEGDALPAARPRFSSRRCYQPKRNVEYRELISWTARQAMKGLPPLTGALSADVKLYRRYRPTARIFGDVDNHLKAIFDGLNQIVFADDAQIVQCTVSKHMDKENPRAEVTIEELKNAANSD